MEPPGARVEGEIGEGRETAGDTEGRRHGGHGPCENCLLNTIQAIYNPLQEDRRDYDAT